MIANGRSTMAANEADEKKFLTVSNSFRLLAKEPTDFGLLLNFISITRSNKIELIMMSLFLPAISRKYDLTNFKKRSMP